MASVGKPPAACSSFWLYAKWAAAPYCAFKNDRARFAALAIRDLRNVVIIGLLTVNGASLPLSRWFVHFF
jgi:hypothetical protein